MDLSTPAHGPADQATWRLLWTVYGAKKPRQVAMAAERIGLAGGRPKLLAALAETYGVTPERARQICQRASNAATRVGPPQTLRSIVERLTAQDSCYEEELVAGLMNDGLLDRPLSVESITGVARLYGITAPQPHTVQTDDGHRLLLSTGIVDEANRWGGGPQPTAPSRPH